MQTAEFNHEDFSPTSKADENLLVRFFYKTVKKRGTPVNAAPEFEEAIYIEIRVAGQRDPQACRPATHADKQRFPRHLAAFQQRVEMPQEGFPLMEWPLMNRSLVEQLSFLNIKTVEQLANLNDTHMNFPNAQKYKGKAKEWLEDRNSNTALAAENEKLRDELEDQAETIENMQKQIAMLIKASEVEAPAPVKLESSLDSEETKPAKEKPKRRSRAKK